MSDKRKLLWVGDAGCDSGFARCTHHTLAVLSKYWDVSVLGINYRGEPHRYPYDIYPCFTGGDVFGVKRLKELYEKIGPDLIVLQNDPWNIPAYTKMVKGPRYVGAIAVDGLNCRGDVMNDLDLAIFWTKFGETQARRGGFQRPSAIIPLGVDTTIYRPFDRVASRRELGLGPQYDDAFIVGNINRNQHRKRLDLTIEYFATWVKSYRVKNAYLFLHVAPTGDQGFDCAQLAQYYGVDKQLILAEPDVWKGVSEDHLALTYSSFDVQVSTSQGEGWGLTTMEGMACGVPQIVPNWAALGEWTEDVALRVPCPTTAVTPNFINAIGGIPDKDKFIGYLNTLYNSDDLRRELSQRGIELVSRPEYRWENIGKKFAKTLVETFYEAPVTT